MGAAWPSIPRILDPEEPDLVIGRLFGILALRKAAVQQEYATIKAKGGDIIRYRIYRSAGDACFQRSTFIAAMLQEVTA